MRMMARCSGVVGCGLALAATLFLTPTPMAAAGEVVGQVGDKKFTMDEVDAEAGKTSATIYQGLYDARRRALEQLIEDYLLEAEAAKRKISRDELVAAEIQQKVGTLTDEEIETWYHENKARVGNRTLDSIRDSIRSYLTAQRTGAARTEFFSGLKKEAGVKISLEPPRVEIALAANDPALGPADAVVTIVEYSDFQ